MLAIPKKTSDRLIKVIPKYQGILQSAKDRDINETDTVHIIKDILSDVFGYDKYSEITSEFAVKNTYCDLAIKINENVEFLIEAKAIGRELKETHLKQAIDYGANKGIPWVILTNGIFWQLHRIKFEQPISSELVSSLNFLDLNAKKEEDQEKLFIISKEGIDKNAREDYYKKTQCVNRFVLASLLTDEPVIHAIRKEIKRIFPDVKIDSCEILSLLANDVIKRELIESEEALKVQTAIKKIYKKLDKPKKISDIIPETRQPDGALAPSVPETARQGDTQSEISSENIKTPEHVGLSSETPTLLDDVK